MTGKRISAEQLKAMAVFTSEPEDWFDCHAIEQKTGLPASTIRHLLFTFFRFGLLERFEVHRGYRYRLSPKAEAQPYFAKLREASGVMLT
jgi:DNA-binding IclR family transcriptional regulator